MVRHTVVDKRLKRKLNGRGFCFPTFLGFPRARTACELPGVRPRLCESIRDRILRMLYAQAMDFGLWLRAFRGCLTANYKPLKRLISCLRKRKMPQSAPAFECCSGAFATTRFIHALSWLRGHAVRWQAWDRGTGDQHDDTEPSQTLMAVRLRGEPWLGAARVGREGVLQRRKATGNRKSGSEHLV